MTRSNVKACHKNLPETFRKAKSLRDSGSIIEKILWRALRASHKHAGVKFRYQHPVSPYIVDFACLPARLVVEIDGPSHDATVAKDRKRQRFLERQGFEIMRISNDDVLNDVDAVLTTILHKAYELQRSRWIKLNPSPHAQSACDPPARGG